MSPVSYSVRFSVGGLLAFVVAFAAPPVPVAAGPSDPLLADGQGAGPPEIVPGHKEEVGDAPGSAPARVPAAPGATRSTWTRGPYTSVQVNVDALGNNIPGDAANEPSIAVDPTAPGRLVIGWRQFDTVASNFRQAGWAYSHDGGHTWTFPGVLEPGEFSSDPVLAVDRDGHFYFYSLQPYRGSAPWSCYLYKSFDGGVTWPQERYARGGDKEWMVIDQTEGIGSGHVYLTWNRAYGCCGSDDFARSTDGGQSIPWPITMPTNLHWGTMSVGPDGELYVSGESFFVGKSTNAQDPGQTPAFDFVTSVSLGGSVRFGSGPNPGGLLGQAWVATDHSSGATRGNVYLLASVRPSSGGDPLDVMFARSTDGGTTWSAPVRVNDDPTNNGAWQWFGTMSVAPTGRIDVIWNDTRNDPAANESEVYYSYSEDAGVTWSDNEPVSPAFNHFLGYPSQDKLGDYYHMVSDELGASLAYAATFNGEQDVYYIRIGTFDCNGNGIDDAVDIAMGTSEDCDSNGVPDECEPQEDCNTNGIQDICDIAAGTSEDCQPDRVPDECELADNDCNSNSVPDDCDIGGGTSPDCQPDGIPDECQVAGNDCNANTIPDDCDIAAGTSEDCQPNDIPDECDIASGTSFDCTGNSVPDECETDCNTNGVRDDCDMAAGTSDDCNTNGQPDECDVTRHHSVWNGFPRNNPPEPFQFNQLMSEVDYNGDGIFWDNPAGNAVISLFGCETEPPDPFDFSVRVTVPSIGEPEEGYVASEIFRTERGALAPDERRYSLSFRPKINGAYGDAWFNHKYDWEFFIYDARSGEAVVQITLTSTESRVVSVSQRGKILVRNPAGPPAYIYSGVAIDPLVFDPVSFLTGTPCYDVEVALDNDRETVKLYVDGELRVETTRLEPNARRMDYFLLRPVRNFAPTSGTVDFNLDRFALHLVGIGVSPDKIPDCNTNSVFDECDIAGGTSYDCDADGVPDECESWMTGDFDGDEDVTLADYRGLESCFTGPCDAPPCDPVLYADPCCAIGDPDGDGDVDLSDFATFQAAFTG